MENVLEEYLKEKERRIDRVTIQPAVNGYLVYLNEDMSMVGKVRPVPYVFETMENLTKFLTEKL
jgi:hypothetical protein